MTTLMKRCWDTASETCIILSFWLCGSRSEVMLNEICEAAQPMDCTASFTLRVTITLGGCDGEVKKKYIYIIYFKFDNRSVRIYVFVPFQRLQSALKTLPW